MNLDRYNELMASSYSDDDPNDYCTERCYVIPQLLTAEQCDQALELFNSYPADVGIVGEEYGKKPMVNTTLRQCEVTYIPNEDRSKWLHDICEDALTHANQIWRFNIIDFSQPMRMMDYREGDHFGSWHQDHGPGQTCYRKLTIVVQLDQPGVDFEGGDFEIAGGGIPDTYYQRGAAIVFPTYYYHRVAPISKGRRRSLVHRAIGPRFQ